MVKACFLEYPEHLSLIQRFAGGDLSGYQLYCFSYKVATILEEAGLPFVDLTDDVLKDEWDTINAWARKTAFSWFHGLEVKGKITVNGLNLGDAVSRPISHGLIYYLKALLRIDKALTESKIEEIIIFEDQERSWLCAKAIFPSINALLEPEAEKRGIGFRRIKVYLPSLKKNGFKTFVKLLFSRAMMIAPLSHHSLRFLGMGDIRHLLPVLSSLAKTDPVLFIDERLQFATAACCRSENIDYAVFDRFLSIVSRARIFFQCKRVLRSIRTPLLRSLSRPEYFYNGKPVSGVDRVIYGILQENAYARLKQSAVMRFCVEKKDARVLILHEDINAFRAAALTARMCHREVVVISHGVPPTRNDWRTLVSGVGVADIIVNSDFEKDKFVMTGYAEPQLHVMGLPRYDAIFHRLKSVKFCDRGKKVVLYCPHMLRDFARHKFGYLGIHTPGALTKTYAISVLTACKKAGIPLWVKLHDNQDVGQWRRLCDQYGGPDLKIFDHRHSIFDLLAECSLVVTTFSSVIVEALLFNRNIISMNYTRVSDIHPYVDCGVALPAHNPLMLEEAICDCLNDKNTQTRLMTKRREWAAYFGGPFDGKNTARVVEFVRGFVSRTESQIGASEKSLVRHV